MDQFPRVNTHTRRNTRPPWGPAFGYWKQGRLYDVMRRSPGEPWVLTRERSSTDKPLAAQGRGPDHGPKFSSFINMLGVFRPLLSFPAWTTTIKGNRINPFHYSSLLWTRNSSQQRNLYPYHHVNKTQINNSLPKMLSSFSDHSKPITSTLVNINI